jgi:hypothetical protein
MMELGMERNSRVLSSERHSEPRVNWQSVPRMLNQQLRAYEYIRRIAPCPLTGRSVLYARLTILVKFSLRGAEGPLGCGGSIGQ